MRYKNNDCARNSALSAWSTVEWTTWKRLLTTVVFAMTLVACGGGGGDISRNTTTNPTNPDTSTNTLTIALSVANTATGEDSNQLSEETPLMVSALVTDQNGNPVADELVTYNFNLPDLALFDPASGTALTNSQGISTIGLTVGTIEGDGLITAQLQTGESAQIGFSSAGDLNDGVKQVALTIASKETGEADNDLTLDNPLVISAVVLDSQDSPIVDELITFSFSQEGLANFVPEAGTALTDANGQTSIDIVAGENAGAGKVIATLSTGETAEIGFNSSGGAIVVTPANFTLNLVITELVSGDPNNQLSISTPLLITTTVTDINGDPVVDQLVQYSLTDDTLAVFDPTNGATLTDENGQSRVSIRVGAVAGDGLVIAELASGEQGQVGFSSAGDASSGSKAVVLGIISAGTGESDNNLSASNPLTIEATVVNNLGIPQVDELINFTLSDDSLAFFEPASGTALTNSDGIARISLLVGQQAGAGKVFATLETSETAEIGFNSAGGGIDVGEQPATLDFFTSALLLASSGSDEVELIALLKNEDNILMEGVDVSFSADSGELLINQGTTAADGTARATLTSQNNPENRTITVTAEAGSLSQNLTIDVSGTEVNINAPTSIILDDTADITLLLADSDGNGIPFQPVTLSSQVVGALSNENPTTDETGQVIVTYSALQSGIDVLTASALNATSSQNITVQEDEFSFSRSSMESDVPLNTDETVTITWLKDNVPFEGGEVVFTTTRGTLSTASGTTDDNGQVSVSVRSNTAGNAVIGAQGTDNVGNLVSTRTELEFVATEVASIIVAASPNSIGPNGQKSTITAVLRDPIGNLVKGVSVGFTGEDVSGGELFPPAAVTDSNGLASTVFTSNTVTSEDAIVITATEASSGLSANTNITVADRAQFISIGTGNSIESPDTASYLKRFSVFVTDANSNPVENVDLTVTGTPVKYTELLEPNADVDDANFNVSRPAFYKGYWEAFPSADAFEFWVSNRTIGCPNEDIDDDAILDSGEDANGDGNLTPGNIVSIDGNITTDNNGQAEVVLRYPKTFAAWITIKITVSTQVAGSENRVSQFYDLGASAEDLSVESTTPNQNPFGDGRNFVQDPADPTQIIDDGTGLTCDNSL